MMQLAGAVGITNCPGAPRLQFLKGRKDGTKPAPDGTVPLPFDSVDKVCFAPSSAARSLLTTLSANPQILARMADGGGFTPAEVVALLSAHSVGAADNVSQSFESDRSKY